MSFTDEDLKRLKEWMATPRGPRFGLFPEDVEGLLARLEAAEKLALRSWTGHKKDCIEGKNLSGGPSSCICDMGDSLMVWRKSCGKDGV